MNLFLVFPARAYFFDEEANSGNTATAGILDFSLASNEWTPAEIKNAFKPGDTATRQVSLMNDGNLDFQYEIGATVLSGDEDACGAFSLRAEIDGLEIYNGGLMDFSLVTSSFNAPIDDWQFYATLSPAASPDLQGRSCLFTFAVHGWQDNMPAGFGFNKTVTLENSFTIGDWVVINELMWMGSYQHPLDEWIELRNLSSSTLDIGGWQLTNLNGVVEKFMLEIPAGETIAPNGFYLITNYDQDDSALAVNPDLVDTSVTLRNSNLQIKLYKGDWEVSENLVDTADDGDGAPLAGFLSTNNIFHFSMERNDIPSDGTLAANWHTCFDDSAEMRQYWDPFTVSGDESVNRGTPTARNLSDYDVEALIAFYEDLDKQLIANNFSPGADEIELDESGDEEIVENTEEIVPVQAEIPAVSEENPESTEVGESLEENSVPSGDSSLPTEENTGSELPTETEGNTNDNDESTESLPEDTTENSNTEESIPATETPIQSEESTSEETTPVSENTPQTNSESNADASGDTTESNATENSNAPESTQTNSSDSAVSETAPAESSVVDSGSNASVETSAPASDSSAVAAPDAVVSSPPAADVPSSGGGDSASGESSPAASGDV